LTISIQKTVHFFEARVREDATLRQAPPEDWPERARAHFTLPPRERRMDRVGQVPHILYPVDNNERQVILGKIVEGDTGLQIGSWDASSFTPVEDRRQSLDDFFARVTYVQFLRGTNAVAALGGAGETPSKRAIEDALNTISPLVKGSAWELTTLTRAGERTKLPRKRGIRSVDIRSNVDPTSLLDEDARSQSLEATLRGMSADLGASLRVRIKISVDHPKENPGATRKMLDWIIGSSGLLDRASKAIVEAEEPTSLELLNLIEHKYTAQVQMPVVEVVGQAFQETLLASLETVCADSETTLQEMLRND